MRFKKTMTTVAALGLALSLAACGGDGGGGDTTVEENPEFEAGTTMAELADAGTITVGTKFDQPGFGLLGLEDTPEGLSFFKSLQWFNNSIAATFASSILFSFIKF